MGLTFDINLRIDADLNSRLNELVGQSRQDRSKIVRLALLDMLNGTNHYRKEVMKSVRTTAERGHGLIIVEKT